MHMPLEFTISMAERVIDKAVHPLPDRVRPAVTAPDLVVVVNGLLKAWPQFRDVQDVLELSRCAFARLLTGVLVHNVLDAIHESAPQHTMPPVHDVLHLASRMLPIMGPALMGLGQTMEYTSPETVETIIQMPTLQLAVVVVATLWLVMHPSDASMTQQASLS
ncbi:MAG: hypothetical protein DRH24_14260 [Deltaproteobacteria bacterium]|nr:MAG: hypothetical protein DRH24_14260 [Deltaproteobacteria bacterium]